MKIFALTFFALVWLSACDDHSEASKTTNSYLPLQVGNSWTFQSGNNDSDDYFVKSVADTVTMNGHSYYKIVSRWSKSVGDNEDVAYYRVDDNGFVYILRPGNNREENRFRLNAWDGDTWSYAIDDNETQAIISLTVATLTIGSSELKDCKLYSFNVETWADEEYSVGLSKGIGFINELSYAWGGSYVLKSATINGREINL